MWPEQGRNHPEFVLNIGGLKVSEVPAILACYGLGSCIGLFLFDRIRKVGGGVHIMLPEAGTAPQIMPRYAYACAGIEALIKALSDIGCPAQGLRGKLVGGANVLSGTKGLPGIGAANVGEVKNHLSQRGIYVAAEDVGGYSSRTARFNTYTGTVYVSRAGECYFI